MTNEEQANEFLRVVGTKIKTHQNTLNYLASKYRYKDQDGLDDILQDVILSCYNAIKNKGLEGDGYNAYLAKSIPRAFQKASEAYQKQHQGRAVYAEKYLDEEFFVMSPKTPTTTVDWDFYMSILEADSDQDGPPLDEEKFRTAFDSLPAKYQEVLNMRVDKMKYREIYRILNLKPSCLKLRIKTARHLLLKKYRILLNDN